MISIFSFFLNDTATTEIYTLSLHDGLPIFPCIPQSGTTQMIVDISLTEGHESHHLGRIYRSAGKDLLSGLCHCPHLDGVLCLWTYSDSLQPAPKLSEKFFTAK